MDSSEIPERTSLWLKNQIPEETWPIFSFTTIAFSVFAGLFSVLIFWPLVSTFNFEEVFFTPVVPAIVKLVGFFGVSFNDGLKILYTFSFAIATVGIYLLVWKMSKREVTAIIASIIFITPPIPIFILDFLGKPIVSKSIYSFFTTLYGDAAIFFALSITLPTVIFFSRYLSQAKEFYFALTVLGCSVILLSSIAASVEAVIILSAVAFNSLLLGKPLIKLRRLFFVILFSVGLVSFWDGPVIFFTAIGRTVSYFLENIEHVFPLPFVLGTVGIFLSVLFFGKKKERRLIFISFLTFAVFLALTINWMTNNDLFLLSSYRFLPALYLFVSIIIGIALTALFDKSIFKKIWDKMDDKVVKIFLAVFFAMAFFLVMVFFGLYLSLIFVEQGKAGFWERIETSIFNEKRMSLEAAGGINFTLIDPVRGSLEYFLGRLLSLFFAIWLFFLALRRLIEKLKKTRTINN